MNPLIIASRIVVSSKEETGWYGSTVEINNFDLRKTKEFGIHIALDKPDSSLHRINNTGGVLHQLSVRFSNPVEMPDVMRWTLESVLRELKFSSSQIRGLKLQASQIAKSNKTPLREEENVLLSQVLDDLGYDSILYDNRGENGGRAVIIWHPEQIKIINKKNISK